MSIESFEKLVQEGIVKKELKERRHSFASTRLVEIRKILRESPDVQEKATEVAKLKLEYLEGLLRSPLPPRSKWDVAFFHHATKYNNVDDIVKEGIFPPWYFWSEHRTRAGKKALEKRRKITGKKELPRPWPKHNPDASVRTDDAMPWQNTDVVFIIDPYYLFERYPAFYFSPADFKIGDLNHAYFFPKRIPPKALLGMVILEKATDWDVNSIVKDALKNVGALDFKISKRGQETVDQLTEFFEQYPEKSIPIFVFTYEREPKWNRAKYKSIKVWPLTTRI